MRGGETGENVWSSSAGVIVHGRESDQPRPRTIIKGRHTVHVQVNLQFCSGEPGIHTGARLENFAAPHTNMYQRFMTQCVHKTSRAYYRNYSTILASYSTDALHFLGAPLSPKAL